MIRAVTDVLTENRYLYERHIEKDGPATELAELLLELEDSEA